jgi:hypothetical protein
VLQRLSLIESEIQRLNVEGNLQHVWASSGLDAEQGCEELRKDQLMQRIRKLWPLMNVDDAATVAMSKTLREAGRSSPLLPPQLLFPFLMNLCFCCKAAAAHSQLVVTPKQGKRPASAAPSTATPKTIREENPGGIDPNAAFHEEIKRASLLPVSYVFEALQALKMTENSINEQHRMCGENSKSLWLQAAGGAQTLSAADMRSWLATAFPVLNRPRSLRAAFKIMLVHESGQQVLTSAQFLPFLKILCRCCRVDVALGALVSETADSDRKDAQRTLDFEEFCLEYVNNDGRLASPDAAGRATQRRSAVIADGKTRSAIHSPAAADALDDGVSGPDKLSQWFREFELEFGMEELVVIACNSSACSAVLSALSRHVKLCIEQGVAASVCHSAWSRLQNFKAVVQLLREALAEGEAIAQQAALRPLLQQVQRNVVC